MKTVTFNGDTLEHAEEKKTRWLSVHNGAIVRETRILPFAKKRDSLYATITFAVSIEIDYDEP